MKTLKLCILALLLLVSTTADAKKKPDAGFEDWLCHVSGGWIFCDVVKPSK
jgi:hypothetical protein